MAQLQHIIQCKWLDSFEFDFHQAEGIKMHKGVHLRTQFKPQSKKMHILSENEC